MLCARQLNKGDKRNKELVAFLIINAVEIMDVDEIKAIYINGALEIVQYVVHQIKEL